MDKKINALIKNYSDNAELMNKHVVTSFLRCHSLEAEKGFLTQFIDKEPNAEVLPSVISLEDVITIFELAIPGSERTANGAVYTPSYIRNYIVGQVLHSISKPLDECLCADIACGCGAFIYTLAETIHERIQVPFATIYHHLYGVDISEMSITRAKILLSLAALLHGEIIEDEDFNLHCGNSLTFDFIGLPNVHENGGFDVVVGNPPYVRSKHIDADT